MPIFLWSTVVNQLQKPVIAFGRRSANGRGAAFGRERVTVVIYFCSRRKSAMSSACCCVIDCCPGGVFSMNDGMPTQIPSPGGSRQSWEDIGIIDGAFFTQLTRLSRLSGKEPLANVVRLARCVRFGPYAAFDESSNTWQFVHANVLTINFWVGPAGTCLPSAPAVVSWFTGPCCCSLSHVWKSDGLLAI